MTAPIVFQSSRLPWRNLEGGHSGDHYASLSQPGQLWERVAESALSGPQRPTEPQTPTPASVHPFGGQIGPQSPTFESTTDRSTT